MRTSKKVLSLFLAVIMAFSVLSVGFVTASAAPTVTRTPDVMPKVTFAVPDYLTTYGTNQYLPGTNVNPVVKGISFYLDGATNVNLSTTSGITYGTYYTSGSTTYWDITGGSATPGQYANFTVTYMYKNQTYTTNAYTWIQPNRNDATVVNEMTQKKTWISRDCETHHQFYLTPTYGKFEGYIPTLVTDGSGSGYFIQSTNKFTYDASESVAAYKWHRNDKSGSSTDYGMDVTCYPTGYYYVDTSAYKSLADTNLKANVYCFGGEIDKNHFRMIQQLQVDSQTLNGAATSGFGTSFTERVDMSLGGMYSYNLTGVVPAAGSNLELLIKCQVKGRVKNGATASMTVDEFIRLKIITFDKTTLRNLVNTEKSNNRQARYYTAASWSIYNEAFANAYAILGKPTATQAEINSAYTALYSAVNSVLVYNSANYSGVDVLLARVPQNYYNHPQYYTTASKAALDDAIADIAYDRTLDMRYQNTVDTMATNLNNALKGLAYNTYSITYDTNGGTAQNPSSSVLFGSVSEPAISTAKSGYTFAGWYTDKGLTTPAQWPIVMPYSGMTLYAAWELDTATVSFSSEGGSSVEPYTAGIGTSYGGPSANPTKSGYTFVGWFKDAALNTPVSWPIVIPSSGMTLYAKWAVASFTMSFDSKGGSSVAAITQDYNSSITRPADPMRTGYGFIGWYYDENFTQLVTWPVRMPAANKTVYAKWSASDFTITFDSNGGSPVSSVTLPVGAQVGAPAAPTRVGYTFNYWTYAGAEYIFSTMPATNLLLVASWTPLKFTITFSCGAGSPVAPITQDCGSVVAVPVNPTLKDYLFDGWLLNGEPYALTTMPSQNLTLVAKWIVMPDMATIKLNTDIPAGKTTLEQGDVINITVNVGTNYYVGSSSFPIYYDTTYFEPALNNQTFTDVAFGPQVISSGFMKTVENFGPTDPDWNLWETGDLTGRVNSSVPQFFPYTWRQNNTTLKEEYKKYGLIYAQLNSGSSSVSGGTLITATPAQNFIKFQLKVKSDAPVTAGDATARIFIPQEAAKRTTAGWTANRLYLLKMSGNVSGGEMGTFDQIVYDLTGADLNYSIVERTTPQSYTISFNSDGGSAVAAITQAQGSSINEPAVPTKAGYVFAGWTYNGESVKWPFTMPGSNVEFKATWTRQQANYTVYYHKQNISATGFNISTADTQVFSDNVADIVTATPKAIDGFTFYENESVSSGKVVADGTLELHLYYTRNTYTISFNSNGGTAIANVTQRFESTVAEPIAPTKEGSTFAGWTLNGAKVTWPMLMPVGGASLTATWTVNSYSIKFYLDQGAGSNLYTTITQEYGTSITAPTVSVPEGYVFRGWNPAVPTKMPASNMDIYGVLELQGYKVFYYLNNELVETQIYKSGAAITPHIVNVPVGYAFSGWSPALPTVMPETDLTVYATLAKKRATVTYYLDNQQYDSRTGQYGTAITPPEVMTPPGFVFSGWSPNITTIPAENTDVYGTLTAVEYSVKFYVNGVVESTIKGASGTAVTAPAVAKDGYTFKGWYSDAALTTLATVPSTIVSSDVELYSSLTINSYTVKFILDGSQIFSEQMTYGSAITAPTVTVPTGYTFSGWSPSVDATVPAKDVTYTGTLVAKNVTLSFFVDGNYQTSITQAYGTSVVAPTITVPDNYTFSGWTPAVPLTMPAENMRFDGRMVANIATVTFDLNGGTGTVPAAVTDISGTNVALPAQGNIVKNGYTFLGWATTASATQALTSYNIPSGNVTLYAVWKLAIAPQLVAVSGSTTVIDQERGYIYGLTTGIDEYVLESYITTLGNAHIEYEYGMSMGTGTKVKLVENDTKEVLATYYIVIFGDIDGDGFINGNDSSISSATAAWLNVLPQDSPYRFAADIDGMEGFNGSDASYLVAVIAHTSQLDQRTGTII